MAWSKSQLESLANTIKNETGEGQNTAERVGQMFYQLIQFADNNRTSPNPNPDNPDISGIQDDIENLQDSLQDIIKHQRDNIYTTVKEIFEGKYFVDGHVANWDEELQAYLISVGVLEKNGDKAWSAIAARVSDVEITVNALSMGYDEQGNPMDYTLMRSWLKQQVKNSEVLTELLSQYAITNDDRALLNWLASGLTEAVNAHKSFASVFATAENLQNASEAISAVQTSVENLGNTYVAHSSLASEVQQKLNNGDISLDTAGLVLQSKLGEAIVDLFAQSEIEGKNNSKLSTAGLRLISTDNSSNIYLGTSSSINDSDAYIKLQSDGNILFHIADSHLTYDATLDNEGFTVGNTVLSHTHVTSAYYGLSSFETANNERHGGGYWSNFSSGGVNGTQFYANEVLDIGATKIRLSADEGILFNNSAIFSSRATFNGPVAFNGSMDLNLGDLNLGGDLTTSGGGIRIRTDAGSNAIEITRSEEEARALIIDGTWIPLEKGVTATMVYGGTTYSFQNGILVGVDSPAGGGVKS